MCPGILPSYNQKSVFLGFKEIPNFLHLMKTLLKWSRCSYLFWKIMWYHLDKWLKIHGFPKAISIDLWNVAPAFISPKGIFKYMKVPQGVVNVVLSWSLGWTRIWLYVENPSSNEILDDPTTLYRMWSTLGRG